MSSRSLHQAGWEARLLLRNGEQLLLTFVIPIALMLGLGLTSLMPDSYGANRSAQALATVLTVSVISAAFTSLAIATGFERRSGALRFMGTTPLSRVDLLIGKALATLIITLLSSAAVVATAFAIGWRPSSTTLWTPLLILLGTAAFAGCGFALAGLFRAEAVLAIANGLFLVLILFGGVIIPASSLPGPMATLAPWLPSGALADGLTAALVDGHSPAVSSILVLIGWLVGATAVSARTFRWS